MININIPDIQNANIQPDYTKCAKFPGFVFYHALKESYIIFNDSTVINVVDSLLNSFNLPGGFTFLVGNNNSNIFLAQPETSKLLKLQVNPNTAEFISSDVFDAEAEIQLTYPGRSSTITGGLIEGNTVILLLAITEGTGGDISHKPFMLYSVDNGGTYTLLEMPTSAIVNNYLTPTGIVKINFYDIYYYLVLLNGYDTDNLYFYVVEEDELLINNQPPVHMQTFPAGFTFGVNNKKHINRQLIWNHNVLYTPSDDRTKLISFKSAINSFGPYTSIYPIPDFEFSSNDQVGLTVTQIQQAPDNTILTPSLKTYLKQDTLSNGATPGFIETNFDSFLLWDEISNFTGVNSSVVNLASYTDDEYVTLNVRNNGGTFEPYIEKRNNNTVNQTINLYSVPLNRFNTGGIHWTGEEVDSTSIPSWHPNDTNASWISHDEDTNIIDYGGVDFDYILQLTIDLPIATTITGTVYYDDEIQDILIDGLSQSLIFNTPGIAGTGEAISLNLPEGPSVVTFQMRNTAAVNPNPTGLKIIWDDITLPSTAVAHSDLFVDVEEDRLYVSLEPFAWVVELSTGEILSCMDILAAELPGGPFLIPSGVDQTAGTPIKWKWLKEFNDVYLYNEYHDTTYSTLTSKVFYNWRINPNDPSYHTMFSAFTLDVTTCTHLHYFFSITNELHGILSSRTASVLTNNFRSIQYRIGGLANFAQTTSDAVTAGPFVTRDVIVGNDGKVYLSKSDEPSNFTDPNSNLFVYINNNGPDIDNGSYTIIIDEGSQAYTYDTFEQWASQPVGYTSVNPNNFDNMGKLVLIDGDFQSSTVINTTRFRKDTFSNLVTQFGNSINISRNLIFNNLEEDIILGKQNISKHWTYFLTYNNITSSYRIIRARSVYYPTT